VRAKFQDIKFFENREVSHVSRQDVGGTMFVVDRSDACVVDSFSPQSVLPHPLDEDAVACLVRLQVDRFAAIEPGLGCVNRLCYGEGPLKAVRVAYDVSELVDDRATERKHSLLVEE